MPRRRLATVAALAALALCAPATAQAADCAGADLVPAADNVAAVGQATLCLLNQQRAAHGLGPLAENAALTTASAGYSQRMVAQGFFDHESPDGGTLVDRLTGAGYLGDEDAWVVGENIGWGQGTLATARSMVSAWMDSPGHRENLLSGDYTEVGLGLALGTPSDQTWGATYTTDFGAGARRRRPPTRAPRPPRQGAQEGQAPRRAARARPPRAAARAPRSRARRPPAPARRASDAAEHPSSAAGRVSYPRAVMPRAPRIAALLALAVAASAPAGAGWRARRRPTRRAPSSSPTSS